ncbi:hypothetical protein OAC78_03570 [Litorivicinus sp.]|nr:hypothetical protein [Litorivicinus sp.]
MQAEQILASFVVFELHIRLITRLVMSWLPNITIPIEVSRLVCADRSVVCTVCSVEALDWRFAMRGLGIPRPQ